MFLDKKSEIEYYSGINSHAYVEKLIKDSDSLLIVSPYIDKYYAHFLLYKTLNGQNLLVF